jgi:flavin reductase (DIM6/NTAB) family NADH-FMN oxidoreductase RutF
MSTYKSISPFEFVCKPFHLFNYDWTLITVPDDRYQKNGANAMTASWGMTGVVWSKPVVYTYVRPQRYTHELLSKSDVYSVSVYDEKYRLPLTETFGVLCGRDIDKAAKCGFTIAHEDGIPYFEEAHTVLLCKKLYVQRIDANCFLDKSLNDAMYPNADQHWAYTSEVLKVLEKE